jgi:uncharacterized repeat protein (TIGR01451 family)
MNYYMQESVMSNFLPPSPHLSTSKVRASAMCGTPGRFSVLSLCAGLLLLLFSAASALADQDPPGCTGSGLGIILYTDAADVHIGDTLHYSILVFNGSATGPVVCDATAIQAFVVTPDDISHTITLTNTSLASGQANFYSNVVAYVCRAQDIQPNQTVDATASDTGVIHQNINNSQGGGNQGVNTQVSLPCVLLTMQCTGGVGQGAPITFSGLITNCGNDTLVNVTVTNFDDNGQQTQVAFVTNLLAGQVAPYSGSWIPASPCGPSTVTLTVEAVDQFTTYPKTVTSSITNTCSDTLNPGITVTKTCPADPVSPGQLLTFSGTVSNTGNVTLTNIVVVNSQPEPNTTVLTLSSLAPGAVANFNASYTAPANCSVSDTLTAVASSICGVAVTNFASATCVITTSSLIAVTQSCPANPVSPGSLLTYSGTVSNAGDVTLTNVVVVNNQVGSTPVFKSATLAPGAVSNFTASYLAPANCSTLSISTATGESICGVAVTNSASTTCGIATAPLLAVTQNCEVNPAVPGGLLTFSGTVSNAGNITLTNVVVLNNRSGSTPIFTAPTMAPGAIGNFTGSYVAPANCSDPSTSIATAESVCGVGVSNSASTTCPILGTAIIAVTETCPLSPAIPGGLLTYSGMVSNAGNITLTNVVVLNNQSGATPVLKVATLPPGAAADFTGTYVAPAACSSTSSSTATGQSICGVSVTNTASATCPITTTPLITITTVCPVTSPIPGGLVAYSGAVSNAGNVVLDNVVILNNLSGSTPVFTAASLAPGAVSTFTGSYVAPANCSLPSTTTATGESLCGVSVTNSASMNCLITTTPLIAVTLACPVNPASLGGLVAYSGTVSNAGNVALTNVVVLNNLSGSTPVFTIATLPPGIVASFTGSYVARSDCASMSTVTATGRSTCGVLVTSAASASCSIITTPAIVVTQLCPTNPVLPGGILTYSGTVSNAGNVLLTNIIVIDNQPASNTLIFTSAMLPPGATTNFTGSYQVPLNCCTVWSTVEASGQGCAGPPVTNAATSACNVFTAPNIVVSRVCPSIPLQPGDLLTYSGMVSNAGNITLTGVTVVDSEPANNSPVLGPITLAPGEFATYIGSYIVPPDLCGGDTVTASGLDACGFVTASNKVTTICPIISSPAINVFKNCPSLPTPRGGLYSYTGSVSNSGNVTLVRVFVVDSQPSNNTPVIGPITLTPGATANFTNSYTAPFCCCSILDVLTARGIDNCSGSNVTATAAADCPLLSTPLLSVVVQCPAATVAVGGLFEFTGSVTNIGNVVLTNVFVYSSLPISNTVVLGPLELAPGQSEQFSGSFIVAAGNGALMVTSSGLDTCQGALATASANCDGTVLRNLLPAAGTYNGLFFVPGAIQNDSSGSFLLTLQTNGTYTASLSSVGTKYATSGKLSVDGKATNYVARPRTNAITVIWEVLLDGSDSISGTVSDGQWTSGLTGYRAAFNAKTHPAPQIGKYTLVIPGMPEANNWPEGDGYGTLTVSGAGLVVFAGNLADGTKMAQSVSLSKSGQWPLYISLYSGGGSLLGWLQFATNTATDVSGPLNWIRPPVKTSKLYPDGFALASASIGSHYVAPVGVANRILEITNGMDILSGGNLSEALTNALTLGTSSKVVSVGPNKLTLTFALPSGLFTGTLVRAGTTHKINFTGVVLQQANYGSGYFLGTNQSGRVLFSPSP